MLDRSSPSCWPQFVRGATVDKTQTDYALSLICTVHVHAIFFLKIPTAIYSPFLLLLPPNVRHTPTCTSQYFFPPSSLHRTDSQLHTCSRTFTYSEATNMGTAPQLRTVLVWRDEPDAQYPGWFKLELRMSARGREGGRKGDVYTCKDNHRITLATKYNFHLPATLDIIIFWRWRVCGRYTQKICNGLRFKGSLHMKSTCLKIAYCSYGERAGAKSGAVTVWVNSSGGMSLSTPPHCHSLFSHILSVGTVRPVKPTHRWLLSSYKTPVIMAPAGWQKSVPFQTLN